MVFLIGMPGSGKSYWGRILAEELNMPLIDMDDLISTSEGESISNIFEQKGAVYFRNKETEILEHIIRNSSSNTIVACGGGTPVYHNNIKKMKANGCVIFLSTDINVLFDRLKRDNTRPLISNIDKKDTLQQMLEQRKEIYEQAHYVLNAEKLSLTTFAKTIQLCIDRL